MRSIYIYIYIYDISSLRVNGRSALLGSVVREVRFLRVQASGHYTECNGRLHTLSTLLSEKKPSGWEGGSADTDRKQNLPTFCLE